MPANDSQPLTTIVGLPAYKFGNHFPNCQCASCLNIITSLRNKPYVQALEERILFAVPHIARIPELESRLIQRAAELGRAKDGAELLQRTLDESRKVNQEREAQLAKKASESTQWARKAEILAQEKLKLAEDLKAAKDLQDRIADELSAALAQVEKAEGKLKIINDSAAPFIERTRRRFGVMPENCNIYAAAAKWEKAFESEFSRAEREIQAADQARKERSVLDERLDQIWLALPESWRPADRAKLLESMKLFAAGWNGLTERQRDTEKQLAEATAALKLAQAGLDSKRRNNELLQNDLNVFKAANEQLQAEGARNARLVPILGSIVMVAALTWLALKIGTIGGSR